MGWPRWLSSLERGQAAVQGVEAATAFSIAQQRAVGVPVAREPGVPWAAVLASQTRTFGVVVKLINWNRSTGRIIPPCPGTCPARSNEQKGRDKQD